MAVSGSQLTRIGASLSGVGKKLIITAKADASSTPVDTDFELQWNITNAVDDSFELQWNISNEATNSFNLKWNISNAVNLSYCW